jgi:hypothetical protein
MSTSKDCSQVVGRRSTTMSVPSLPTSCLALLASGHLGRGVPARALPQSPRGSRAAGATPADKPLVLVLDDLHWADPASVELLGALLRRPPAAAVLIAVAVRPRQAPERLSAALNRARHDGSLVRVEVGARTPGLGRCSRLRSSHADMVPPRSAPLNPDATSGALEGCVVLGRVQRHSGPVGHARSSHSGAAGDDGLARPPRNRRADPMLSRWPTRSLHLGLGADASRMGVVARH